MGLHTPGHGQPRRLGSLLRRRAAARGRNFLLRAGAQFAEYEVAYREPGALIEQDRLFRNLTSSVPLTINLFAPLRLDAALAKKVLV